MRPIFKLTIKNIINQNKNNILRKIKYNVLNIIKKNHYEFMIEKIFNIAINRCQQAF